MLMTKAEEVMSDRKSVVMLLGRLLMSTLFLYVGITEVQRQWASVTTDASGHQHHQRAKGDGHDNMWSKLCEFILSIPFVLGFKSKITAILLAVVLVLEALVSWLWFFSDVRACTLNDPRCIICPGSFRLPALF
jgi:alanyl-tRNA synthetase